MFCGFGDLGNASNTVQCAWLMQQLEALAVSVDMQWESMHYMSQLDQTKVMVFKTTQAWIARSKLVASWEYK